jgi:hypothetical protein
MNYPATTDAQRSTGYAGDRKTEGLLLSAATITGDEVYNLKDEKLGTIEDIMLDIPTGTIRYAVLSSGGFLGMGDRLFAVPWSALRLDAAKKRFNLDVDVERLNSAPGFNKHAWPNMADSTWKSTVESYYATPSGLPEN